jgi:transcriptional regulator with XRE-family HTH domain
MEGGREWASVIDHVVGARIKARRLAIGMSQTKLAKSIGLSFSQIQKYEKADNRIGAGALYVMAEVLEVPVTYFYDPMEMTKSTKQMKPKSESRSLELARKIMGLPPSRVSAIEALIMEMSEP